MSAKGLTLVKRGDIWHAQGRVCYNGTPITGYLRESTGTSSEIGARAWIEARTGQEIRRHLVGDEYVFTFADAVMLYSATPEMAKYLMPITARLGAFPVSKITPKSVRDLAQQLYPMNCTDSWRRWVITPVRAVINNAHDLGRCPAIKIKGFTPDEREAQDALRGKPSRIERQPGSWSWLLAFREHAPAPHAALALFMFTTGARIGQAVAMHPKEHLDLQNARACVPSAKGFGDRWLSLPMEVVVELANLPAKHPRGWKRKDENLRVFGFADRHGPLAGWRTACRKAGIEYLPPHSAGRHGFGQEMNVRQDVDEKSAGAFGGWRDTALMKRTYTHAEDADSKIHSAFRTGLAQAETETGLKLLKKVGK